MSEGLSIFTIYNNPSDYPGKFVVRRWVVADGQERRDDGYLVLEDTLEAARLRLPQGMVRMNRNDDDDPVIVENWL